MKEILFLILMLILAGGRIQDPTEEQGERLEVTATEGEAIWNSGFAGKEEFLTAYGFETTEPYYEYYDPNGVLQLELYLDEESESGCGIRHFYYVLPEAGGQEAETVSEMHGFVFDAFEAENWTEQDKFALELIWGGKGTDEVTNYKEKYEYNENGQITLFQSSGDIEEYMEEGKSQLILRISFEYREDGTLCHRSYAHNFAVGGSWFQQQENDYDFLERLVYTDAYVTHGSYDVYYIYEGDRQEPSYCLELDFNLGSMIPRVLRYEYPQ